MCFNDDLEGPDFDPDAFNDEDKGTGDFNPEFQDDDNYKVDDDDGLA